MHVPLFEPRGGSSKLILSPHGNALGRAAIESLSELGRAVDAVRERKRPNSVVIGTTASFAARWLIPRLPQLQQEQPSIDVSILPVQAVLSPREQGADIVIRIGPGPWPSDDAEPLMDDCLYPVVRPAYWAGLGLGSTADKLRTARLIHDRDPAAVWEKWLSAFPIPDLDLLAGARFASSDLVLDAAAAGLGVALARGRLAQREIDSGRLLRPFGDDEVKLENAYWLIRSSHRRPSSAQQLVEDWITRQALEPVLDED